MNHSSKTISTFFKSKRASFFYVLLGIILAGLIIFLRLYHFHDWLNFKWDQARDGFVVANAVENGPQFLPLLGPRATDVGQTEYLRLGPAYFYLQYLSAIIFHSVRPEILALPDLFFSTLAIVALFFLLRIYFSSLLSTAGAVLYGTSFLVVQYSRFAWNPNSTSFFVIVFLYCLIKLFNDSVEKRIKWAALLSVCFSIGTQLHFFTFFLMVGLLGVFFIYKLNFWSKKEFFSRLKHLKEKQTLKLIATGLGIVLVFYSPVIGNEIITKGENSRHFLTAFSTTSGYKSFSSKIIKSAKENFENYAAIITTFHYENEDQPNDAQVLIGLLLFFSAFSIAVRKLQKEKNGDRKDFLFLILALPIIFYIISFPVAFQLRPRFFVSIFALPFIFLILIFSTFKSKNSWIWLVPALIIFSFNLREVYYWFNNLAIAQERSVDSQKYFILKMKEGHTLVQLEKAADYLMKVEANQTSIYQASERDYGIVLDYLFYINGKADKIKPYTLAEIGQPYFALYYFRSNGNGIEPSFRQDMKILFRKDFGQLSLIKVQQRPRNNNSKVFSLAQPSEQKKSYPRLFIGDLWHSSAVKKVEFASEYFE